LITVWDPLFGKLGTKAFPDIGIVGYVNLTIKNIYLHLLYLKSA
jgi:hypothetical protein